MQEIRIIFSNTDSNKKNEIIKISPEEIIFPGPNIIISPVIIH